MKIACIDRSASDRLKLHHLFEDAYESARNIAGHVVGNSAYPATLEEALLSTAPDVIAVGPTFNVEEAYSACRKLNAAFPNTTLFLFLSNENYSLRSLRRFSSLCTEVFSVDEPKTRLLHKLAQVDSGARHLRAGKLILIDGVKGGVGATTITAGLAHAAEAAGKTAVVVDLSPYASLIHYMQSHRWQSPDYATALLDGIVPDKSLVERCLVTAPNGVSLLLPPSGGTEIRELWLRDAQRFEITLSAIDILKDMYDMVLVDTSNAEGVLYFALATRAHSTVLVTSNDPASVHLLNAKLSNLASLPGESLVHVLINLLVDRGLTKEDVVDFLHVNDSFTPLMATLEPIPHEPHGRNWIGTGNTFYTESSSTTQQLLEETLATLLLTSEELERRREQSVGFFVGLRRIASRFIAKREQLEGRPLALPHLKPSTNVQLSNYLFSSHSASDSSDPSNVAQPAVPAESNTDQGIPTATTNPSGTFRFSSPVLAPTERSTTSQATDLTPKGERRIGNGYINGKTTAVSASGNLTHSLLYESPKLVGN